MHPTAPDITEYMVDGDGIQWTRLAEVWLRGRGF
jgi:hypothetical protein